MAETKELQVYLERVDYLGAGQRSFDIGVNLLYRFLIRGKLRIRKAENITYGSSERYHSPLFYKRLSPQDFPYEIDIRTQIIEEENIGDDDMNLNPVPSTGYIVQEDDTDVPHKIEVMVHEDADPQQGAAVFHVHFKAVLKDLPGLVEEPEEPAEPVEEQPEEPGAPGTPATPPGGSSAPPKPAPLVPGGPVESPFHHYMESILTAEMDILAFVSDTHIGADDHVDDFDAADDAAFAAMIRYLQGLNCRSKELILLGDFLELWETRPHFKDLGDYDEKVDAAKSKISKIIAKHPPVFQALAGFSQGNKVTYVYGNHDDELQEGPVRSHFSQVSGVKATFGMEYQNDPFEVFAQHGHQFDKHNWTANPCGETIVGRWIVENFIVPMENIKSNNQTGYFSPIDSFDGQDDFIDYVRCLKKEGLIGANTFREVDDLISRLNNDLSVGGATNVAKAVFGSVYNLLQAAGLKTEMDQFEAAVKIVELFKLGIRLEEEDYSGLLNGTNRSCILMGHTHEGYMKRVGAGKLIVNTGTWQDKLTANPTQPCQPQHMTSRHLTILIKRKSTRSHSEGGHAFPIGSEVVQAIQCSAGPGGMTNCFNHWYYLVP